MKNSSDIWRRSEFGIIAITLALITFGAVMIYATGSGATKGVSPFYYAQRQLIWAMVGLVMLIAAAFFDFSRFKNYVYIIYGLNLSLLIGIALFGKSTLGAQRWFAIGSFQFQPSEFAKLATIITLAVILSSYEGTLGDMAAVVRAFAFVAPPLILILLQPDLGTALVLLVIAIGMMIPAGIKGRHLVVVFIVGLLAVTAVFQFNLLKEYQANRLVVFLNPDIDPKGSGYNLRQSMIAIGSGGVTGKGLLSGTQSRLNFIPERHTDFIFAVVGEELGFVGGALLVFGFFLLIARALAIGANSRNLMGLLLAVGIASMWAFQVMVNIGMTIGIMPITGIPLPFISYGGTSIVTNMIAVGMLLSIYSRRFR